MILTFRERLLGAGEELQELEELEVREARDVSPLLSAAAEAVNVRRSSISVAIPVFNEAATIREVVRRVKGVTREKEILIVDDGSTDGTRRILEELAADPEVRVFLEAENRGKGAALRRAFEAATKDVVIVQDADLEYDPAHFEALVKPIDLGLADAVYGSRFLDGRGAGVPAWHRAVNRCLTAISNALTGLCLSDMETCQKAFRRDLIQSISLDSDRFGFEPEITAKLARLGRAIIEVPISYHRRSYEEGKKITWRDGVAALWHVARFALSRAPILKDQAAALRSLARG